MRKARWFSGDGVNSLELEFVKSSYCENESGLCVEVAKSVALEKVGVRHSSFPGGVIYFSSHAWGRFIRQFT